MELLFTMPYTCALDVVDLYPDGLTATSVGIVLGMSRQAVEQETEKPHVREACLELRRIVEGD